MIATTIVILTALVLIFWYVLTFNSLVSAQNGTEQSWSNIEVELKRRYDLIGNLVEVVRGYAVHESETLMEVVALRGSARDTESATTGTASNEHMSTALRRLMVIVEAYPNIKADRHFQELLSELVETENRIAARRNAYNQTVNLYLNLSQAIPHNLVAVLHAFQPKPFFDAPDNVVETTPRVSLS